MRAIEEYFNQPLRKGKPEADRFDVLATLIKAYERKRQLIDVILCRTETVGFTQADLARLLGSHSRVFEC